MKFKYFSDDMIRGFFEADGYYYVTYIIKKKSNSSQRSISFHISYQLDQARHQKEHVEILCKQLGANISQSHRVSGRNAGKTYSRMSCTPSSQAGQELTRLFEINPPLITQKRKSFRVLQIVEQLQRKGQNKSRAEVVMGLALIQSISEEKRRKRIEILLNSLTKYNITEEDLEKGMKNAENHISNIEAELESLYRSLPNQTLSFDYMRGFHLGDGSLTMVYIEGTNRLTMRPVWSITVHEKEKPLLLAFKNTINAGFIHRVNGNALQYILQDRENFTGVLLRLIGDISTVFKYKHQQWERVYKATLLLNSGAQATEQGWCEVINLTYDVSVNHKRKKNREYYMKARQTYSFY